jgi:hypothetical protein
VAAAVTPARSRTVRRASSCWYRFSLLFRIVSTGAAMKIDE